MNITLLEKYRKITAKTLLLDMDGVLADVSKSYRTAIISTCHAHGATSITYATITEWKAKGGYNNDWKLCLDLIKSDLNGRKNITLKEVTDTFECIYQGDPSIQTTGLFQLETLIPEIKTLYELKKICGSNGMAIVTGRPRRDCIKFLEMHNICHFFDVCICMEDGPAKPNPFPVLEACKLLNVKPSREVIMVGDTPDDIRAAQVCGCRGIGVITPDNLGYTDKNRMNQESFQIVDAMKECGADTILKPGLADLVYEFYP